MTNMVHQYPMLTTVHLPSRPACLIYIRPDAYDAVKITEQIKPQHPNSSTRGPSSEASPTSPPRWCNLHTKDLRFHEVKFSLVLISEHQPSLAFTNTPPCQELLLLSATTDRLRNPRACASILWAAFPCSSCAVFASAG